MFWDILTGLFFFAGPTPGHPGVVVCLEAITEVVPWFESRIEVEFFLGHDTRLR